MAHKAITFSLSSAVAATAIAALAGSAAAQSPQAVPTAVKPSTAVVAGYLAPQSMQESLNSAWGTALADFAAKLKAAEEERARQAAEAAAAAAAAAAQQAAAQQAAAQQAAAQSAPAQSYSAPVDNGSYNAGGDVASWANSAKSNSVKQCESGGNYSTNTGNGYYGAWQFDLPSWLANGGGAYAPRPDLAPAWAQDQVAYNYYQNAGWGPWACG